MATQITNYQCPACTGPLHFVGRSGKLACDYCGKSYTVAEIEALYAEKDARAAANAAKAQEAGGWDDTAADVWSEAEAAGLQAYNCPSCGAELVCDATTAAASCPYCGNPAIIPGQLSGARKPDLVIPFQLDKAAAMAALRKHYQGRPLLPKGFAAENHIEELKGVYVPFWLFDGEAEADVRFEATKSESHREGDYEVTVTDHFEVRRAGTVPFENIPVDASTKMPDQHMESIEPYRWQELVPFSTAYLPGYLADRFDVPAAACTQRADERAAQSAVEVMRGSVSGYDSCRVSDQEVALRRGRVKYALLPVWLLNTKWKDKDFLFAMNGQTGRLVGDLPVSMGRFWAWFGGIAGVLAALGFLLVYLTSGL